MVLPASHHTQGRHDIVMRGHENKCRSIQAVAFVNTAVGILHIKSGESLVIIRAREFLERLTPATPSRRCAARRAAVQSGILARPLNHMMGQARQTLYITNLPDLEESRRAGLLVSWEELMSADPTSTFYQGPAWCMEWYRSYGDRFRPLILLVTCDQALVGIVPLAVEKSTGRLTFATDNMADYRDVVALPAHRKAVVAETLRIYKSGSFPNMFRLGPTQPESETVRLVRELTVRKSGLRAIARTHPCQRFWFGEPTAAMKIAAKESVRRRVNYYKRQGPVSLQRIADGDSWDTIKNAFFDQHSLRQLAVGRPVSFNETRKRVFYDALIKHHPESVHVTVLRAAGKFIAGHYGYVWRGVLYWGASAFDIREEKYSPGQVLIALLLQNASAGGISGVDFTLGTEDFKQRFGNDCVSLPTVEIYARYRQYFIRRLRDRVVTGAKIVLAKRTGAQKWRHVTQLGEHLGREAQLLRESGLKVGLARLAQKGLAGFARKNKDLIFTATPEQVRPGKLALAPSETCSFRTNEINDLLKCEGASRETERAIAAAVKGVSALYQSGRTLHTLLLNDRLAGWGWSDRCAENAPMTKLKGAPESSPEAIMISGVYVLPEYRRRQLEQALLSHLLKEKFDGGARRAYVLCDETNAALRGVIERAGFRLAASGPSQ